MNIQINIEILNPWASNKRYWRTEVNRALKQKSFGMLDNSIEANIMIDNIKFTSFQIVEFYEKLYTWMKSDNNDFKFYCDEYDESQSVIIRFKKLSDADCWRLTSEIEALSIQLSDSDFRDFLANLLSLIEKSLKDELDIDIIDFT
ncbi:MAG: hypothetical protein BM556_08105 [Bacteriovorax sp. MedPE-SWde]|nr:MAG: hypothetical protein BM556_08105 [Bacteriovorax sp. MedPE-SWde]